MASASNIKKRSITVASRRTSVCLEDIFWDQLRIIAEGRGLTLHDVVSEIDFGRDTKNLSSAIRMFVVSQLLGRAQVAVQSSIHSSLREARL